MLLSRREARSIADRLLAASKTDGCEVDAARRARAESAFRQRRRDDESHRRNIDAAHRRPCEEPRGRGRDRIIGRGLGAARARQGRGDRARPARGPGLCAAARAATLCARQPLLRRHGGARPRRARRVSRARHRRGAGARRRGIRPGRERRVLRGARDERRTLLLRAPERHRALDDRAQSLRRLVWLGRREDDPGRGPRRGGPGAPRLRQGRLVERAARPRPRSLDRRLRARGDGGTRSLAHRFASLAGGRRGAQLFFAQGRRQSARRAALRREADPALRPQGPLSAAERDRLPRARRIARASGSTRAGSSRSPSTAPMRKKAARRPSPRLRAFAWRAAPSRSRR